MIKTKIEIVNIAKACAITDAIFKKIISNFNFQTEIALRDFISKEIKSRGLRPAFPPIVTSGPRAGNEIHPKPTDKKLSGFVIIDFGVRVNGYCSDMTRTIFVGKPTKEDKKIYELVLSIQEKTMHIMRDGIAAKIPDELARKLFGAYAKYFIHTLGHGLGRKIHESPKIFFRSKHLFKKGMAVTCEPGLYIPNKLGIRIEDTAIVDKKAPKILTKSSKKLLIFPL